MFSWLIKIVSACWRPVRQYVRMNKDDGSDDSSSIEQDSLFWYKDLEKHSCGEFSFAVVQANSVIEDQSQVETGLHATFIGVYDGHGGPDAARFVSNNLFRHLTRIAHENGTISEDILRRAVSATEDGFLTLVRKTWGLNPLIAAVGSCCLIGLIWKRTLYVANLGDSRAVLGCLGRSNTILAEQLTKEHNASQEEVRRELKSLHPQDSQIVVLKQGTWRVKGIIQVNPAAPLRLVSRSIGDAYLKTPEFHFDPSVPRFHLSEPIHRPVLTAEPSICSRVLQPNDRFLIFASDGLWEHMTNKEVVEIVHNNSRAGIAKRLIRTALSVAASKREMRYQDIKMVEKGTRRHFHDDITVVVIFIDHGLLGENTSMAELSIRGFVDAVDSSENFEALRNLA